MYGHCISSFYTFHPFNMRFIRHDNHLHLQLKLFCFISDLCVDSLNPAAGTVDLYLLLGFNALQTELVRECISYFTHIIWIQSVVYSTLYGHCISSFYTFHPFNMRFIRHDNHLHLQLKLFCFISDLCVDSLNPAAGTVDLYLLFSPNLAYSVRTTP